MALKANRKLHKQINIEVNTQSGNDLHAVNDMSKWLQAAEDARLKISYLKKKIRCLEEAIQNCEEFARTGQKWPGEDKQDAVAK